MRGRGVLAQEFLQPFWVEAAPRFPPVSGYSTPNLSTERLARLLRFTILHPKPGSSNRARSDSDISCLQQVLPSRSMEMTSLASTSPDLLQEPCPPKTTPPKIPLAKGLARHRHVAHAAHHFPGPVRDGLHSWVGSQQHQFSDMPESKCERFQQQVAQLAGDRRPKRTGGGRRSALKMVLP